jgi:hypothetical protein
LLTGLASILQFKHGPSTIRAYFVILAMFVDFFDLTSLAGRWRNLLPVLHMCEAFLPVVPGIIHDVVVKSVLPRIAK